MFDIKYLGSSRSCFLLLEMLFKVWGGDLRKSVTADSTHGTVVCTAEYQGGVSNDWCMNWTIVYILVYAN